MAAPCFDCGAADTKVEAITDHGSFVILPCDVFIDRRAMSTALGYLMGGSTTRL